MKIASTTILATTITLTYSTSINALEFDEDVTNAIIMGTDITNGGFTVDRADGVELGLRAKLRHNSAGAPENTFNSNGDGTYTFQPIIAPTQSASTAEWSFEWSINSNYTGTSGYHLNDLTYELSMVSTSGGSIPVFDPINGINGATSAVQWDHAIGDNNTLESKGTSIPNSADDADGYAALIDANNLAQNSWKPHWFVAGFDPTDEAVYTFTLTAYDGATQIASTSAAVVTPEPTSLALLVIGGLTMLRRRR